MPPINYLDDYLDMAERLAFLEERKGSVKTKEVYKESTSEEWKSWAVNSSILIRVVEKDFYGSNYKYLVGKLVRIDSDLNRRDASGTIFVLHKGFSDSKEKC